MSGLTFWTAIGSPQRKMQKASALLDVAVVFSLTLLLVVLVSLSPVGQWQRQVLDRPFTEYVVMAGVPVLVLTAARRNLAAYGLSLRPVTYHLDIAVTAFLPVALASAVSGFVDYRGRDGSFILAGAQIAALLASGWLLRNKPTADAKGASLVVFLPIALWGQLAPARMGNALSALIFYVCFLGAGEELLFRGYIQSRLNAAFGKPFQFFGVAWGWGVAISAGLFGLMHMLNLGSLVAGHWQPMWWWGLWTFFAGLVFGFVREKSGSVVAPALLHGLPQAIAHAILGL